MRERVFAALLAAPLLGCGGAQRDDLREGQAFRCRDRAAGYLVTRHLGGDELGVHIDCAAAGPRLRRWRVDRVGNRQEDARSLSPGEFDALWKEIDGTGWPNLRDCANGTGGKDDPLYTFDIKDDQNQASFQCQSLAAPYPYNDLVDPLDLAAQKGRRQLGDDEPPEMKALDGRGPPTGSAAEGRRGPVDHKAKQR